MILTSKCCSTIIHPRCFDKFLPRGPWECPVCHKYEFLFTETNYHGEEPQYSELNAAVGAFRLKVKELEKQVQESVSLERVSALERKVQSLMNQINGQCAPQGKNKNKRQYP